MVKEEVANISSKLATIEKVLHDAERRRLKNRSVGIWLEKLEDITYEMDDKRIAKAILDSPGKSSPDLSELEPLLQLLKETFSGKRFLLVLDDVWTEDDSKWKPFQDSLKDGAPGSWQNVLDSEIWQLKEAAASLFPHLYLSYNELPPELKRCFSYCAVFPKDHEIDVEELIRLWIAQGYVRPIRRGERLELVGFEYFNNLAMRSFFQEFKKSVVDYVHEVTRCKMHDIVHDFAQFLTKNEFCHVLDGIDYEQGIGRNSSSERARHLTILEGTEEMFSSLVIDFGRLRSFFAYSHGRVIPQDLFSN
ncbi:putative disease resistance protein RGA3 [Coffea eugenioides]|uniref:putative disease resistance protein RGA3 n=1 Tax=Coffea eugenioides TaxID=49369 RepID=UPI000F60D7A5|nr:putative disease resistance protein RGA3 [Coffea eugenioides]